MNSKDFGTAQNRERIYIVCFRKDIDAATFDFPAPSDENFFIRDILEYAPIPSKYYLSEVYLETLRKHKQRHAAAGNGFGVASSSALEYLDRDGRNVFKQLVSYSSPAVVASANGVLFCDLGTEKLVWVNADGEKLDVTPYDEVLTVSMNERGSVALTTAAAGYKGLVSVYDSAGKLLYQWWSGSGYVLDAVLSPDDKQLAVLCAESGGGRLHVLRLDSETERSVTAFPDELPFDLAFLGNDALCAVSQETLTFLTGDGTVKERFVFGDYYLMDYAFGDSFAAVYVSAYRSGGAFSETTQTRGLYYRGVE